MSTTKLHTATVTIAYVHETVTKGGLRRFEIGASRVGTTDADPLIYGRFTGKIITMKFGAHDQMAEVELENCRHGSDACFVNKGDVRQVAER